MNPAAKLWVVSSVLVALVGCGGIPPPPAGPALEQPQGAFARPEEGAGLNGEVTLSGSASSKQGVFKVELQLDGGDRVLASGTEAWQFPLDTLRLVSGAHTLTAWVTDRKGMTASAELHVMAENAARMAPSSV